MKSRFDGLGRRQWKHHVGLTIIYDKKDKKKEPICILHDNWKFIHICRRCNVYDKGLLLDLFFDYQRFDSTRDLINTCFGGDKGLIARLTAPTMAKNIKKLIAEKNDTDLILFLETHDTLYNDVDGFLNKFLTDEERCYLSDLLQKIKEEREM